MLGRLLTEFFRTQRLIRYHMSNQRQRHGREKKEVDVMHKGEHNQKTRSHKHGGGPSSSPAKDARRKSSGDGTPLKVRRVHNDGGSSAPRSTPKHFELHGAAKLAASKSTSPPHAAEKHATPKHKASKGSAKKHVSSKHGQNGTEKNNSGPKAKHPSKHHG